MNTKMKTLVEIIATPPQNLFVAGDKGYIDGYIIAANGQPCAIVVCNTLIDLVPIYGLKVINQKHQDNEQS